MNIKLIEKSADFMSRIIVLLTTVIALNYFSQAYDQFALMLVNYLLIASIIAAGLCKIFGKRETKVSTSTTAS